MSSLKTAALFTFNFVFVLLLSSLLPLILFNMLAFVMWNFVMLLAFSFGGELGFGMLKTLCLLASGMALAIGFVRMPDTIRILMKSEPDQHDKEASTAPE